VGISITIPCVLEDFLARYYDMDKSVEGELKSQGGLAARSGTEFT